MPGWLNRNKPIIFLLLLSPVTAELLSGSSPPLEFFNPLSLLILVGLYGIGVLLAHELVIKWNSGWAGVLLLGLAYGIIEEGLAIMSFFNPEWIDLGILGVYGRWAGVNWVWSVCLTIFHAIYSIAIPIALFNLLFPHLRRERLLTVRGLKAAVVVFLFVVAFIALALSNYWPGAFLYLLTAILVAFLVIAARKVKPSLVLAKSARPLLRPAWFGVAGAVFGFSFFFIMYAVSAIVPVPVVPILLEVFLCLAGLRFLTRNIGRANNAAHQLAFVGGLLAPTIFLAFIQEMNGTFGMSVVAIFFIGFLIYIRRKIKTRELKY